MPGLEIALPNLPIAPETATLIIRLLFIVSYEYLISTMSKLFVESSRKEIAGLHARLNQLKKEA
jgi:hypothetical protein